MKSAHPKDGTTLSIAELTNGMVVTLSIADVGGGQQERHIWKTSYPLLDLLYPHWIPKQQINTDVDFLAQVLQKSSQAFGWNFLESSKYFHMPMESFGEGVDSVVVVQERGVTKITNTLAAHEVFTVVDRETQKIGEAIVATADIHTHPFFVVIANFSSVEIVECLPRKVGAFTRWEYKVSTLAFAAKEQQVDYFTGKKFLPFMATHVPENLLFNTLMNAVYWKPLATSSALLKDIWRSITTALIAEVGAHTTAAKIPQGTVYVTGEIPLFIQDTAMIQLAVVDGLGLSGTWEVVVDDQYQLLPLISRENARGSLEKVGGNQSLWIIPQDRGKEKVTKMLVNSSEIAAVYGNLYTYGIHNDNHVGKLADKTDSKDIILSNHIRVSQIILDRRPWPVVYGPNSAANSVKVPLWLDRIKQNIQVI